MYSPSELGIFTDDWQQERAPGRPRAPRDVESTGACVEGGGSGQGASQRMLVTHLGLN